MKYKYFLILIFLVILSSNALALTEDKILRTDITNITVKTWFGNNESICSVYFKTENMEGDDYYEKTINSSKKNITEDTFIVRVVKSFSCNLTSEKMMIDFFNECETDVGNKSCKEAYLNCNSNINYYKNLSFYYPEYVSCLQYKSIADWNSYNCTQSLVLTSKERDDAKSQQIMYAIVPSAIILLLWGAKSRFGRTREDRQMGTKMTVSDGTKYLKDLLNRDLPTNPKEDSPPKGGLKIN